MDRAPQQPNPLIDPPAALIDLIERPLRTKLGPDDRDWNCSYCHKIVDHWNDSCPRCLRSKAVAA